MPRCVVGFPSLVMVYIDWSWAPQKHVLISSMKVISAIHLLVAALSFCTYITVAAQTPGYSSTPVPIDEAPSVVDQIWPDFKINRVSFRNRSPRGYPYPNDDWIIAIYIENIGGNKGINQGFIPQYMPLKIDILQCLDGIDVGNPDYKCIIPMMHSNHLAIKVPLAGEATSSGGFVYSRLPHDIYVHANANADGTHGPYREKDSPSQGNNKAFLRIIWDQARSSYNGWDRWVWPNDEDSFIY